MNLGSVDSGRFPRLAGGSQMVRMGVSTVYEHSYITFDMYVIGCGLDDIVPTSRGNIVSPLVQMPTLMFTKSRILFD